MKLFDALGESLAGERDYLLSSPLIVDALRGDVSQEQYVAFLREAWFHVRETVPLLMACGSRLGHEQEWLRKALAHYIDDEYGHEQWILNDIEACGVDPEPIRNGTPSLATEFMVAYAWDTIQRRNPVGFFGMVYVLEGTSVAIATAAAHRIQHALGLPADAFTYLLSHGSIDTQHIRFLEDLINRIEEPADREAVVHCASRFFCLYAQIFRTLPDRKAAAMRPDLRAAA